MRHDPMLITQMYSMCVIIRVANFDKQRDHCCFAVVYEHRARLERSLQKEKADHKNAKLG